MLQGSMPYNTQHIPDNASRFKNETYKSGVDLSPKLLYLHSPPFCLERVKAFFGNLIVRPGIAIVLNNTGGQNISNQIESTEAISTK